ncbi:MAG: LysM peptidoglycan-binding domain-containing protein, partial [Crocinitomicaceae bacterium]|nr:LysM peptidoglycan-binding domain-containing protein [Crocinitomicaceae bacterium]
MKTIHLLAVGVFFLLNHSIIAQEVEKDSLAKVNQFQVHEIKGNEYYIHVVEKGNTLYAISRMYSVPIEVLKEENPRLNTTELTIGDRLLIPVKEVRRKNIEETVDVDGNYIIHEVQRKHTLYSIAKEYNIEIKDIITSNPQVEEGLKKGMRLRIPVAKLKSEKNEAEYVVPAAISPYVTHYVEPKDTLYSLSKEYAVTIDSIKWVNNGLLGGLKVGQLINIPILKVYEDTVSFSYEFDSSAVKSAYRITLMLPFYLDLMEQAEDTNYQKAEKINDDLFSKSKYAIEFYRGFRTEVDSMVQTGMNIKLRVIDTANDTAKVAEVLKDSSLLKTDLIVGPLFFDEFMMVADYAKKYNIHIVSPVKQSNKILLGNSQVSKVASSDPVLLRFIGEYMYDSLRNDNLIMVYPDHVKESRNVELIKNSFFKQLSQSTDSTFISPPKEIKWDEKRFTELKVALDSAKRNVLIVPSEDQAFVTRMISMLSVLEDTSISIYGLEKWERFDNIDVDYLQNLNVHLFLPDFLCHQNIQVQSFERQYVKEFKSIPDQFTYLGFDVAWYYTNLLNKYGLNFE